jgi:hypothetical protein
VIPVLSQRSPTRRSRVASASYASLIATDCAASDWGYWRLGESVGTSGAGSVIDASGKGHHATPTSVTFGSAGAISGDSDTAASLNGTSSIINAGNVLSLAAGATLSIEAWININSTTGNFQTIAARRDAGGFEYQFRLTTTTLALSLLLSGGSLDSTLTVSTGVWTYVAVKRSSGGTVTFYKNSSSNSPGSIGTFGASTRSLYIGAMGQPAHFLNGVMDEVVVTPTILSDAQYLAHYNKGIGS